MPTFDYATFGLSEPKHRPLIPGGGPQTVAEVLDRPVAEHPDRTALVGRSGRYSFRELDHVANRAAQAFCALGVKPGDRVAACLANDADIVIAMLAAARMGALWVGINRPLAPREKLYMLADSGAVLFLSLPAHAAEVERERAELPNLAHIVVSAAGSEDSGSGDTSFAALLASASDDNRLCVPIDPFAPAAIAYTSGTTGFPKGATHSQHNMLLPGALSAATNRYGDVKRGVVLPMNILNLMVLGPLTAFQDGACCVAMDRTDAEGVAEWVREEQIGAFVAVPTILQDLLTHPKVKPEDLASLVCPEVGGATVPENFRLLYRERFGQAVKIGYGMTEAPTAVTWSEGEDSPRSGLCGKAQPYVEIRIQDEDGRLLPAGQVGEICVAPARSGEWKNVYTPMLGYWNKPEASAEALRGGVYHTGDLGFLADDGNLFIRGRRNELILRGGANIYPAEVERVLEFDPRVAGSAVLGIPDVRLGERVVAVVELEPGAEATAEELLEGCRRELAKYKVPSQLVFVDSLPRNAMSKVVKRELAPLFAPDPL